MDQEKKEFGRWWMWILGLVIVTGITLTGLNYIGIIGKTAIEREVFEQSYQKQAGDKAKANTYQAQQAELNAQLADPTLTEAERATIRAQLAAIRIQLQSI